MRVEGKSPCGMVTVTVTGQQMPVSCDISEEAMSEGAKVVGEKVCLTRFRCPPFGLSFCKKEFQVRGNTPVEVYHGSEVIISRNPRCVGIENQHVLVIALCAALDSMSRLTLPLNTNPTQF